jgi:LysM repeat protein
MAVEKAYLEVLEGAGKGTKVKADFNPQSLQITYRSSGPDGSQETEKKVPTQGTAKQPTGNATEISMDLLFDTTQTGKDVRGTTIKVANMLQAGIRPGQQSADVPHVRFHWGTFIFEGNVTSVSETIDFFSEPGVPLRSTVKLSMTEVKKQRGNPATFVGSGGGAGIGLAASAGVSAGLSAGAGFSASASLSAGVDIGTTPLTMAQAGDSLQALAGRAGVSASWKGIAAANNIDNPRTIPAGTPINLSAGASAGASASFANGTASASAGASASFGAGA